MRRRWPNRGSSGGGFLLDDHPGSYMAFSLRYIASGWVGNNVIQVVRWGDEAIRDFTASELNDGTITDWVSDNGNFTPGQSIGRVVTWYDQTGNGRHMEVANVVGSTSHLIVDAGVLTVSKGTVGVKITARRDIWRVVNSGFNAGDTSMFCQYEKLDVDRGTFSGSSNATYRVGRYRPGSGASSAGQTDDRTYVDGVLIGTNITEGDLDAQINIGDQHIVSFHKIDASNSSWQTRTGMYGSVNNNLFVCDAIGKEFIFYNNDQESNDAAIVADMKTYYPIA